MNIFQEKYRDLILVSIVTFILTYIVILFRESLPIIEIVLTVLVLFLLVLKNRFAVFCSFVALLTIFSRSFAHRGFGFEGFTVYVTELMLFILILPFLFEAIRKRRVFYMEYPMQTVFLLFYIVIFTAFIRGMMTYDDKLFVIRHSALFYYSLFYFLVPLVVTSMKKIEILLKVFFVSTLIITLAEIFRFTSFGLGSNTSVYLGFAVLFNFSYLASFPLRENLSRLVITIIQSCIIVFSMVRAVWVGLFSTLLFIIVLSGFVMTIKRTVNIILAALFSIVVLGSLIVLVVNPKGAADIVQEAASINPLSNEETTSSQNTKWRLYVWSDIINEALEKPLFGWGLGKKFIPLTIKKLGWGGSWRDDDKGFQDPHNSYLSIFHRTGLVGLTLFLTIVIGFISHALRFVTACKDRKIKVYITGLILCIIFLLGTSLFMVVLEGPFLGIFLWVAMGLIVAIERENTKQQVSYGA